MSETPREGKSKEDMEALLGLCVAVGKGEVSGLPYLSLLMKFLRSYRLGMRSGALTRMDRSGWYANLANTKMK